MDGKRFRWGLVLGAALLAGCDKQDEPATPAAPAPPAPDVTPKTSSAATDAAGVNAGSTTPPGSADIGRDEAGASTPTAPGPLDIGAGEDGPSTTTTPDRRSAAGKGGGSAAAAAPANANVLADDTASAKTRAAEDYLAETARHLKDQKPDLARQSLARAEAMQESLPKTVREQIKTTRASVDNFSKSEDLPTLDEENK